MIFKKLIEAADSYSKWVRMGWLAAVRFHMGSGGYNQTLDSNNLIVHTDPSDGRVYCRMLLPERGLNESIIKDISSGWLSATYEIGMFTPFCIKEMGFPQYIAVRPDITDVIDQPISNNTTINTTPPIIIKTLFDRYYYSKVRMTLIAQFKGVDINNFIKQKPLLCLIAAIITDNYSAASRSLAEGVDPEAIGLENMVCPSPSILKMLYNHRSRFAKKIDEMYYRCQILPSCQKVSPRVVTRLEDRIGDLITPRYINPGGHLYKKDNDDGLLDSLLTLRTVSSILDGESLAGYLSQSIFIYYKTLTVNSKPGDVLYNSMIYAIRNAVIPTLNRMHSNIPIIFREIDITDWTTTVKSVSYDKLRDAMVRICVIMDRPDILKKWSIQPPDVIGWLSAKERGCKKYYGHKYLMGKNIHKFVHNELPQERYPADLGVTNYFSDISKYPLRLVDEFLY